MNFETDIALERLVEAKGIVLSDHRGRCPFADHEAEDTLVIDSEANTWACTAGCGDGGVVDWVARTEGVSAAHAEALLRADFEPTASVEKVKTSTTTKLPILIEPGESDEAVLRKVVDYYHRVLISSPEGLVRLRERGITDPEVVTHFQLGLCDRTLGYRLPKSNRKAGRAVREQLKRLGILRKSGHEHFRGSLVVPIFDLEGKVANAYGRKLNDNNLRKGTPIDTWLDDSRHGVLNRNGIVEGQRLVLTGSVVDALTWWSAGMRNVTTTTSGLSLMEARNIPSVVIAVPRDEENDDLLEQLRGLGVEVRRVVFPRGMDASGVARNADDPREALDALLRASEWVSGSGARSAPRTSPRPSQEHQDEPAVDNGEVVVVRGDRRWRVRGLEEVKSHSSMRVNLYVANGEAAAFHVDVVELYSARQRGSFLSAASSELGVEKRVLKKDLGAVMLKLEAIVDDRLRDTLDRNDTSPAVMSEADRARALEFLRDPRLLDRVIADLDTLGVVGEVVNKQVAYLAAISRKLPRPLAVVLQSSPGAGKSALLDAVLRLVPDEDVLSFSAITGRSLFYLPADGLRHKVLALAEEEGAGRASYALKLLQSEGELSIASTAKDGKSGRLSTQTYAVSGPVALLMTTTSLKVDEELLSRCLVLSTDEGRDQTRAVHLEQRRRLTLDALTGRPEAEAVVRLHHDAQRLLRPLPVVVPEALSIDFTTHRVRHRRDFAKVLGLVQAVALLRQHQRPVREAPAGLEYIEATTDDVAVAVKLAAEVMGTSMDEVPPVTRAFLGALRDHVVHRAEAEGVDTSDVRFTRRELREQLGTWGDTRTKIHLARLAKLEYVIVHASRGVSGRRVFYELNWSGDLEPTTQSVGPRSPHGRPTVAPQSPHGHGE